MHRLLLLICFLVPLFVTAQAKTHWTGTASYYHPKFHGRTTSTGATFNQEKLTAASNIIPIGSKVKVTNLKNNKTVIVVINDRMSRRNQRLIDLSVKAANTLGFQQRGLCKVKVELVARE